MLRARRLVALVCAAVFVGATWSASRDVASADVVAVEVTDFQFSPASVQVWSGDNVMWRQHSAVTRHTITSDTGLFDSGPLDPGQIFSLRMTEAGSYPYHCSIHPEMVGTFAVTIPPSPTTTTTTPPMTSTTRPPTPTTMPPTTTTTAAAPTRTGTGVVPVTSPGPASSGSGGYWMLEGTGAVHGFGGAKGLDSPELAGASHIAATRTGNGYWVLSSNGRVEPFGDAADYGSASVLTGDETYTTMAATPTGRGYWLFTNRGRVVPFGDATFLGDMRAITLNGPVLDAVATPSGRGYYMVASDGGIFTFGDAAFRGSMGGRRLNRPVMSMAPDADGSGYWLVASDGGIFAFDAPFYGSAGHLKLNQPISGIVGSPTGAGYLMVAGDGGIFSFGDVPFYGSLGASPPPSPVVSVTAFAARHGFTDGTYRVGPDIAPGTYRTVGAPTGCYWARLNGLGNSLAEINANHAGDGPAVVTIAPTDLGFKTQGCGTWTHRLERITSDSSFGQGTMIVGIDVAPGIYRSSGPGTCYWARLTGFGGTLDDIITNEASGGLQTVTITAGDAGFTSSQCGDWIRYAG